VNFIAGIPSPSSGSLDLGPLKLNAYGAMIALGVMAAVWLAGRRMEKRGIGTRDDMGSIAMVAVPVGIIGARLYHVVTDWQRFENNLGSIVQVWKGGLGIWGGIALGTVAGVWFAKRKGISIGLLLTCVAPALPLAQGIGRWGELVQSRALRSPNHVALGP
jgi:prolipoprotein diacylglyceryl transferase